MSIFYRLLCALIVAGLQCPHNVAALNSDDKEDNMIIGDSSKQSVCITEKHDIITSFYQRISSDPRYDSMDEQPSSQPVMCHNKSIWMSVDSKFVIYWTSHDLNLHDDETVHSVGAFGVFSCAPNSYQTALKSQSADIPSSQLCVDPASIYPDSYPGCQCQSQPVAYCLPFRNSAKCPQVQSTMNSMYNAINPDTDFLSDDEMHHFYQCDCWYKANVEDASDDERMHIELDFNEDCVYTQQQRADKQQQESMNILKQQQNEQPMPEEAQYEYEDEVELEKNKEFGILWATLGFFIGVILLIVIVIYSFRTQYDKKMYLSSRKYYRNAHYGEIENHNLMMATDDDDSETETDTESGTGSDTESDASTQDTDGSTDLSEELAYEDGTTTANYSESITNHTDNTTLKV